MASDGIFVRDESPLFGEFPMSPLDVSAEKIRKLIQYVEDGTFVKDPETNALTGPEDLMYEVFDGW